MKLCSDGHEEVCYETKNCPVCDRDQDLPAEIDNLRREVEALQAERADLRREAWELQAEIDALKAERGGVAL